MKKQTLTEKYSTHKPIGCCHITNTAGLQFYEPIEDDIFDCDYVVCLIVGDKSKNWYKHKVHYDGDRPYITKLGSKFYLDEVMRTVF